MGTFQPSLRWLVCPLAAYMLATTGCSFMKDTAANIAISEMMNGKINRGASLQFVTYRAPRAILPRMAKP
mgnify:CR=1 FL=1